MNDITTDADGVLLGDIDREIDRWEDEIDEGEPYGTDDSVDDIVQMMTRTMVWMIA